MFRLTSSLSLPVDVSSLRMEKLIGLTSIEAAGIPIWHGKQQIPCGEIFSVTGNASDESLIFQGNCSHVKSIGTGLISGTIRVEGDAGMHLGAGMAGGEIQVSGNAGDWAGAEMRKGTIHIAGNAGHQVGGSYPGSKKGMAGGEILIRGSAGHAAGTRQRRGLIAVAGNVGDGCGAGMIAGTIVIGGQPGLRYGAGMKRGSIVVLSEHSTGPGQSAFRYATTAQPTFLQLYFRHLRAKGFRIDDAAMASSYRIYRGDMLELGLGEILCRDAN